MTKPHLSTFEREMQNSEFREEFEKEYDFSNAKRNPYAKSLRETINELAQDMHQANMIDKITLRELTEKDSPELHEYTG